MAIYSIRSDGAGNYTSIRAFAQALGTAALTEPVIAQVYDALAAATSEAPFSCPTTATNNITIEAVAGSEWHNESRTQTATFTAGVANDRGMLDARGAGCNHITFKNMKLKMTGGGGVFQDRIDTSDVAGADIRFENCLIEAWGEGEVFVYDGGRTVFRKVSLNNCAVLGFRLDEAQMVFDDTTVFANIDVTIVTSTSAGRGISGGARANRCAVFNYTGAGSEACYDSLEAGSGNNASSDATGDAKTGLVYSNQYTDAANRNFALKTGNELQTGGTSGEWLGFQIPGDPGASPVLTAPTLTQNTNKFQYGLDKEWSFSVLVATNATQHDGHEIEVNGVVVATLPAGIGLFDKINAVPGTRYDIRARAYAGTTSGAWSTLLVITTDAETPADFTIDRAAPPAVTAVEPLAFGSHLATYRAHYLGEIGTGESLRHAYYYTVDENPGWYDVVVFRANASTNARTETETVVKVVGERSWIVTNEAYAAKWLDKKGAPFGYSRQRLLDAIALGYVLPFNNPDATLFNDVGMFDKDLAVSDAFPNQPYMSDLIMGARFSQGGNLIGNISGSGGFSVSSHNYTNWHDANVSRAAVKNDQSALDANGAVATKHALAMGSVVHNFPYSFTHRKLRHPQFPWAGENQIITFGTAPSWDSYSVNAGQPVTAEALSGNGTWLVPMGYRDDYGTLWGVAGGQSIIATDYGRDVSHLANHGEIVLFAALDIRMAYVLAGEAAFGIGASSLRNDTKVMSDFRYQRNTMNTWKAGWWGLLLSELLSGTTGASVLWAPADWRKVFDDTYDTWVRRYTDGIANGTDYMAVATEIMGGIDMESRSDTDGSITGTVGGTYPTLSRFMAASYGLKGAYFYASRGKPKMLEILAEQIYARFHVVGGALGYFGGNDTVAQGAQVRCPEPGTLTAADWAAELAALAPEKPRTNYDGVPGGYLHDYYAGALMVRDAIQRAANGEGLWAWGGRSLADIDTLIATMEAAIAATTAWYSDTAAQEFGQPFDATLAGSLPPPPSNLTLTVDSDTQITASWADNSTGEGSFSTEYATNSSFTGATTISSGANATSQAFLNLAPGTTYWFRVRARMPDGTTYSSWSNAASATTASAAASTLLPVDGFSDAQATSPALTFNTAQIAPDAAYSEAVADAAALAVSIPALAPEDAYSQAIADAAAASALSFLVPENAHSEAAADDGALAWVVPSIQPDDGVSLASRGGCLLDPLFSWIKLPKRRSADTGE